MSVSLLFMLVSAAVCLFLPTVVALIYIKKTSASWKAFLLGAIVFTVSQLLTRIPLLGLLQGTAWFQIFTMTNTVVYIFLLALSAGIFEELGRYFGIKLSLKKDMLTWQNGFAFGLGHGGIEAFLLAGLPLVNIIINTISGQNSTAVMSPPADFLLGGVERIIAVALHIGLTMLVLYAVRHKKTVYLIFAIAAHTCWSMLYSCF